jgi:hypothetical protein
VFLVVYVVARKRARVGRVVKRVEEGTSADCAGAAYAVVGHPDAATGATAVYAAAFVLAASQGL